MSDRGVETRPRPSRRWLLRLLLVLIVGCVALSVWLYQLPGRSSQQPGNPSAETSSASEITPEELAARINHDTIAAWVAQCLEVPNFHTLPLPYLALFDTGNYRPYNETPVNPKRALLNNQEHEVISLSKFIYVQRS